jgi:RNA polymerase sigma-70 factor (ECF subfamily)
VKTAQHSKRVTGINDEDDHALVVRAQGGDRDAYGSLFSRHHPLVYRVAWRMTGNHAEADDIAQDVFVRAHGALPRYHPNARFSTWLYRITVNCCRDYLKSGRRRMERGGGDEPLGVLVDPGHNPEEALAHEERRRLLERAIPMLPPKYREIVILRDIEERPYSELEEILELPASTLKVRAVRGRERLARLLAQMEE